MSTVLMPPETTASPSPPAIEPEGRYEVIGSQVVEKPPMGAFEATFASWLFELMAPFVRSHGLGQMVSETLFDLRPEVDCDRRPDLAFVSAERWPIDRRAPRINAWSMVPDLAIEIISPTNMASELLVRVREYLQAGTRLVWIVYPLEEEVHVYDAANPSHIRRFLKTEALDGGAVLPGFRLDLATLFTDDDTPAA
jgi:Uma2 family endonuclease